MQNNSGGDSIALGMIQTGGNAAKNRYINNCFQQQQKSSIKYNIVIIITDKRCEAARE